MAAVVVAGGRVPVSNWPLLFFHLLATGTASVQAAFSDQDQNRNR